MKRLNNKGVSLIEILIAVVVFTICVTPLIYQLITGIRIGQRADNQQAATDYAKSVAETIKQMPLESVYTDDALDELEKELGINGELTSSSTFHSIKYDSANDTAIQGEVVSANSYLVSGTIPAVPGTAYNSVSAMQLALNNYNLANSTNPDKQEALVRDYLFDGEATIDYRDYDVHIELSTEPYALNSLKPSGQADPNKQNLYNLSSLDSTTTAVITNMSNYDATATGSYFNMIVAALEMSGDAQAAELLKASGQTNSNFDNPTKTTTIQIDQLDLIGEPNADYNYRVTCRIAYNNPGIVGSSAYNVNSADASIQYVAYEQMFKNFPDIYLMYNQFMYNKTYKDDNIQIVNNTNQSAKLFVIWTADDDTVIQQSSDAAGLGGGSITANPIVPDAEITGTVAESRNSKNSDGTYMATTNFVIDDSHSLNPIQIFTNMDLKKDAGDTTNTNVTSTADRRCKISVASTSGVNMEDNILDLSEDERYSETGRIYEIRITLTNKDTGLVTTFDTSKGDY